MGSITEDTVRRLKRGQRVMCGSITGFGVRRTPKRGTVVFFVRRCVDGKDVRERLGTHPGLSVREARVVARNRIAAIETATRAKLAFAETHPTPTAQDPGTRAMLEEILLRLKPEKRDEITFSELREKLQPVYFDKLAHNTTRVYYIILKAELLPTFGHMAVADITPGKIRSWFQKFEGKNEQQGNNSLKLLLAMLRKGQEFEILRNVPDVKIKRYEGKKRFPISERNVARLTNHIGKLWRENPEHPHLNALIFFLNSGERKYAGVSLKTGEVNIEKRCITKQRKGKKTKSLAISDWLARFLLTIWPEQGEYFFASPNSKTGHINERYILRFFQKICGELGITTTSGDQAVLHCLRHTYGTILSSKLPLKEVKELLGHGNLTTTMRYVHGDPERAKEGVNTLVETQVALG